MSAVVLLPLAGLAALGVAVLLDERGLFGGVLRTPVLVGIFAGALGGDVALGLVVGVVFALLWPAPIRSGGHRALSPGVAALVGAGAVSVGFVGGGTAASGLGTGVENSVAQVLSRSGNASVALAVLVGSLGALGHQRCELFLRGRLGRRFHLQSPSCLRKGALREVVGLGVACGLVTAGLGFVIAALSLVGRVSGLGWDGGAWPWVVLAAILGAASELGRARGRRSAPVEWSAGAALGLAGGLVIASVW